MMNVSAFCKTWICHTIFLIYIYIYVISWNCFLGFLQNTICNLDMPHDTPHHIYICVSVKLNEFDMPHDIPHIYICVFEAILCFICHTIFHIYIYSKNKHSLHIDIPQGSFHGGAWPCVFGAFLCFIFHTIFQIYI